MAESNEECNYASDSEGSDNNAAEHNTFIKGNEHINVKNLNPGEDELCLGFIEDIKETWRLQSKYFPSKVGGYPAWLSLEDLPSAEQLACQSCSKPMAFLLQLYLPDSTREYAFHRIIFLFVCRDGNCSRPNSSNGLKVFRCQLPRDNKYYDFDAPAEEENGSDTPSAAQFNRLCIVCGSTGKKACARCKSVGYCSREHQVIHWSAGHKAECKQLQQTQGSIVSRTTITDNSFLFREAEITLEPYDTTEEREENVEAEMTKEQMNEEIQKALLTNKDVKLSEDILDDRAAEPTDGKCSAAASDPEGILAMEEVAGKDNDKIYCNFMEKIEDEPEQIIRYNRGGGPLYCSKRNLPPQDKDHNRICCKCKKERTFEFQVMPHLLNHLGVTTTDACIDWGVLLVYTCYCITKDSYNQELIYRQDFSE